MAASNADLRGLQAISDSLSVNCLAGNISRRSRMQGYKYFVQGYLHQIKIEPISKEIVIKAQCFRSMKKSAKPHSLLLNLDGDLASYSHCSCTAGLSGKCSHVVGLIQALMHYKQWGMKEVPADMSCTQLQQLWGRPRGLKIRPESVLSVRLIKPTEPGQQRKRQPIRHIPSKDRVKPVADATIQYLASHTNTALAYLLTPGLPLEETELGPVQLGSSFPDQIETAAADRVPMNDAVHPCGTTSFPQPAMCTLPIEYKDCNEVLPITWEKAVELEAETVQQAECEQWYTARKQRLTASNFHRVVARKRDFNEKFTASVLSPKRFSSVPTSYGTAQEHVAKETYSLKNPEHHVHECGFVVNPDFSFLGASPDAKVCCNGFTGIMEVKCPYTARDLTVREAIDQIKDFCLTESNGMVYLKPQHDYMTQIQGQLMVTGAPFCEFVLYTRMDMHIQRILPDKHVQQEMLEKLSSFYKNYALPYLQR